ncbi:MAG: hypothetical protein K1Y01_18880 [Vicinamibacteria bacterium]|nr:hypothetical protein [Vicinamibacteria bacterium]
MSKRMKSLLALTLVIGMAAPPRASAWGERGHDIVTRVAVRLLAARIAKGTPLATQFGRKEFMLGHLSNVPDIVWRNQGEAIENANAPTHFLDMEYVSPELTFSTIPKTPAAALARMKELCANPPKGYTCAAKEGSSPNESSAGTAPWRTGQMYRMTVESLRAASVDGKSNDAAIDRAFLTAGLMSHFVGDLGNPYHATVAYDGWESGQGGIHGYFESAVVSSYRLALDQEVFDAALTGRGIERTLKQLPAADRAALSRDPVALAMALALDSRSRLDAANAIDLRFAILKKSGTGPDGKRVGAERRDASELRFKYHDLTVERLATAAEILANLWLMAWEDAGKPDFKGYRSFAYPVAPDFIQPDYLSSGK